MRTLNVRKPAWLWVLDGEGLAFSNDAARLLTGKIKHKKLKSGKDVVPIKGQVKRLMRLGSFDRESRARVNFLAGDKPLSFSCVCTPVRLQNQAAGLLIVGKDKVSRDLFAFRGELAPIETDLLLGHVEHVLTHEDGTAIGGSVEALAQYAKNADDANWVHEDLGDGLVLKTRATAIVTADSAQSDTVADMMTDAAFEAQPMQVLDEPNADAADIGDRDLAEPQDTSEPDSSETLEPDEQVQGEQGQEEQEQDNPDYNSVGNSVGETEVDAESENEVAGRLTGLMDQMSQQTELYAPLSEDDDILPDALAAMASTAAETSTDRIPVDEIDEALAESESNSKLSAHNEASAEEPEENVQLWRITGVGPVIRDMQILDDAQNAEDEPGSRDEHVSDGEAPDESAATSEDDVIKSDQLDQTAKYNFDALSKILSARVNSNIDGQNGDALNEEADAAEVGTPAAREDQTQAVALGSDLVVLNRLPLAILLFREQRILFANRAFMDLIGCPSLSALRELGLAHIFPQIEDQGAAGPIVTLNSAQGDLVGVDARLQTIPWQSEAALMLTASKRDAAEATLPHAASDTGISDDFSSAAHADGDLSARFADQRGDGVLWLAKDGTIVQSSDRALTILGHGRASVDQRPFSLFAPAAQNGRLRAFFARKHNETSNENQTDADYMFVAMTVSAVAHIFALPPQDTAGSAEHADFIVQIVPEGAIDARSEHMDAALLARLSRGLRRPLNTIMGFSQLIEAQAFGPIQNPRYVQYARDIVKSGHEISEQIDELDDYTRIEGGNYSAEDKAFDLTTLLEECESVVRQQASVRQVFVRSAISEALPHIHADRPSMRKALLNLLASAIDQTDQGGKVILSATISDDGSIEVHVRDSGRHDSEFAERFAVFREKNGQRAEDLVPMRSSMGLALTRSLLAVNSCALSVSPSSGTGNLMTLKIPRALIVAASA